MTKRILVATACLLVGTLAIARVSRSEPVPPREPLASMPWTIGEWKGRDGGAFDERILRVLAVDDYLNRVYGAGSERVGLYVGYYRSQREGDTIHSPLNCLPGAGWEPVKKERVALSVGPAGPVTVNQFTIEKGLDREIVLYWYQSHGRIVASEYWGRAYMVLDALRLNRTDGALVRVIAPVNDRDSDGEAAAQQSARRFASSILPTLSRYLPD